MGGCQGKLEGDKLGIEVKEDAKLYHIRAFPIPKSREEGVKKEISRLCQLTVLKNLNNSTVSR